MTSQEILEKYFEYFKDQGHKQIPNASLVPENDPSVLFTTAGMHPLIVYLMGEEHPQGQHLTNVQRCVRTDDIEEVGDTIHLTFFEMLGFWSLGSYFKRQAINMSFEFLTSPVYMGFDPDRMYVTVFEGDKDVNRDDESIDIWKEVFKKHNIHAEVYGEGSAENARILPLNKKENWWGPVGNSGPCGPDSEIFYWRGVDKPNFEEFVPWDTSGMFIELGNNVFMQYNQLQPGSYELLKQKNVDFGGGFERISLVSQFRKEDGSVPIELSVFDTDLFIEGRTYVDELAVEDDVFSKRAILDHMRAVVFLLMDNVIPSNKDQGYILRRLLRRSLRFSKRLKIEFSQFLTVLGGIYIDKYSVRYSELISSKEEILDEISKEVRKFEKTLNSGSQKFHKLFKQDMQDICKKWVPGASLDVVATLAFNLYQSDGYPFEMVAEDIKDYEFGVHEQFFQTLEQEFTQKIEDHQEKSRAGAKQKFAGGLADHSDQALKYHTATHLLHLGLRKVLGNEIVQHGSNITSERLRFDFNYGQKLTDEQLKEVERVINSTVDAAVAVNFEIMPKEKALETGAIHAFNEKYGDEVKVYYIGETLDSALSKEFCGGPHVKNTSEIGPIEIYKQDKIGRGLMRIYAR